MKFVQSFCVLDAMHRILYVGGDWDAFALANRGAALVGHRVAGTVIFDHVTGFEMRALVNAILHAVGTTRRPYLLDYRCDSPGVRRTMRMSVSRLRAGRYLMVHDVLHEEDLGRVLDPWQVDQRARDQKCSVCCAVLMDGMWTDPFLLTKPHPSRVRPGICPACRERATAALAAGASVPVTHNVVDFPSQARAARA